MNKEELTFEQANARISEIVKLLENQNTPLDESLKLFEEGVSLIKTANEMLEKAEQKVNILSGKTGDN